LQKYVNDIYQNRLKMKTERTYLRSIFGADSDGAVVVQTLKVHAQVVFFDVSGNCRNIINVHVHGESLQMACLHKESAKKQQPC